MTNKQLSVSVIIIVLLLLVFGGVVYVRNANPIDDEFPQEEQPDDTTTQNLVVTHAFDGEQHEYTGSVVLPTPCHTLESEVLVAESFPEQITINLRTVAPEEDVACIQVLERATFDIFVTASEGAKLVRVVLDGTPVDFEIFEEFKG